MKEQNESQKKTSRRKYIIAVFVIFLCTLAGLSCRAVPDGNAVYDNENPEQIKSQAEQDILPVRTSNLKKHIDQLAALESKIGAVADPEAQATLKQDLNKTVERISDDSKPKA